MREIAYLPLAEDIPITFNSCRQGPRGIEWRSDRDAEVCWTETQVRQDKRRTRCWRHLNGLQIL